jgi:hypothetical protein
VDSEKIVNHVILGRVAIQAAAACGVTPGKTLAL